MKRKPADMLTNRGIDHAAAMKAIGLTISSYYYRLIFKWRPRAPDTGLVAAINDARQGQDEVYGYREGTEAVRAMDMKVNGKMVPRHLRSLGSTQPRTVKSLGWTHPAVFRRGAANSY